MAGADHRKAETDGRGDTSADGEGLAHGEVAAAFARVADALGPVTPQPDAFDSDEPSLEEPWDASAADALSQLYASGEAGLARPLLRDSELQAKLNRMVALAATARDASEPDEDESAGVRGEISLLLAQVQDMRAELGRLAALEANLDTIKSDLADERRAEPAVTMPGEEELTRFAEAAAQKALRGHRETPGDLAAIARLSERSRELQGLITGFIDEQRQGDQQVADALETMQQAMQHILDRIEAIESAQAALLESASEAQRSDGDGAHEGPPPPIRAGLSAASGFERGESATGLEAPVWADLGFGDEPPQKNTSGDSQPTLRSDPLALPSDADEELKPFPLLGARKSDPASKPRDHGPPFRSGILLAASLAAFLLAGYWLVSGPRLRLPDNGAQTADQQAPGETPEQSPALRLFSASPEGQRAGEEQHSAGVHTGTTGSDQAAPAQTGAQPDSQAQHRDGGTSGSTPWTSPSLGGPMQWPDGVVIEQGSTAMAPEELLQLRQRQRMASLSSRLGQQMSGGSPQPVAISAAEAAHARDGTQPAEGEVRTHLELPPLMIGPHSLRHAAATGDASAQFEVAARFAEGKGVDKDFKQAVVWYQRAAMQGLAAAQYRLAALYEQGVGVPADLARAKAWYKRAAEQGNVKAMHNLAVLSANGSGGTAPDYATAAQWFAEAAAYGLADSQYNLGILYENGLGIGPDLVAAFKWYALAAQGGDKEAVRRRDLVKGRLSPATRVRVESEVAAWRPKPMDELANDARLVGQAWKGQTGSSAN